MKGKPQKDCRLKIGTLLNGQYRIEEYLSSGGFGNTYRITTNLGDEWVIKELFIKDFCGRGSNNAEISISLSENKDKFDAYQEKFKKEAQRLHDITNSHIVKVNALFDENGTSYYVMDYIKGESLSARLRSTKRPLEESELMEKILPQVLDALECVHKKGIYHLDIKPANIMMDGEGNVKLIDFGASKQMKDSQDGVKSTSTNVAYTEGYAPIEQVTKDLDRFGPWTDLYALGATIYNLLTNRQPPSQSDISEKPGTALKLPEGVSTKTQNLVVWLMKPNRLSRPQSVAEVIGFLNGESDTLPLEGDDNSPTVPEADTSRKIDDEPPVPSSTSIRKIIMVASALVVLGGGIYAIKRPKPEPIEEVHMVPVQRFLVAVSSGPSNMRQYSYTGDLVDTLGALPNGEGTAEFAKYNNIPAAMYKGQFVNGICEDTTGNATMTFTSGDQYIGTFKGGFYEKGKYICADKSYFEGTFKKGEPYNGTWYKPNGEPDGKVINGKEQ